VPSRTRQRCWRVASQLRRNALIAEGNTFRLTNSQRHGWHHLVRHSYCRGAIRLVSYPVELILHYSTHRTLRHRHDAARRAQQPQACRRTYSAALRTRRDAASLVLRVAEKTSTSLNPKCGRTFRYRHGAAGWSATTTLLSSGNALISLTDSSVSTNGCGRTTRSLGSNRSGTASS
jgi:hypothetical protein